MATKKPSITIFISVRNGANFIRKCIDSLLDQTYKNKQIYVIDNMSTDNTYEILKSYGKKIRLEKVTGRVPKIHNHVLRRVKTDLIAYTDADCIARKDWIEKLVSGFTSDDIIAVAGYAGTPKSVNKLQKLIGRELEARWKKFPEFITRAPTINLCIKTKFAKKVKFDESFFWAWETDFGYRLSKLGKIRYFPKAVVNHYHRSTFRKFFYQQMNNAKIQPFLWSKHRDKMVGDHISTSKMGFSLFLAYLVLLFLSLGFISRIFFSLSSILFILLFAIFLVDSFKLKKSWDEVPILMGIFLIRTAAWVAGIPIGILYFLGFIEPRLSGYDKRPKSSKKN